MVRWMLWLAAIVAFTLAMFPLSFVVPVVGIGLGRWAGRTRLGRPAAGFAALAGWVVLTVWHIVQHLGRQVDRSGEPAGGAVFVVGASVLVWAAALMAKRGNRFGAAGIAVVGGPQCYRPAATNSHGNPHR